MDYFHFPFCFRNTVKKTQQQQQQKKKKQYKKSLHSVTSLKGHMGTYKRCHQALEGEITLLLCTKLTSCLLFFLFCFILGAATGTTNVEQPRPVGLASHMHVHSEWRRGLCTEVTASSHPQQFWHQETALHIPFEERHKDELQSHGTQVSTWRRQQPRGSLSCSHIGYG